jgi:hypothetical protein
MVTIASGETGAAETTANNMVSVIQTVLAAQMVARGGILDRDKAESNGVPLDKITAPTLPRAPKPEEDPAARKW